MEAEVKDSSSILNINLEPETSQTSENNIKVYRRMQLCVLTGLTND